MQLYHGSNVVVEFHEVTPIKKGLDFGEGFYLTSDYQQAANWARTVTKRRKQGSPKVSIFEFSNGRISDLKHIIYKNASVSWLEMIKEYRTDLSYKTSYDLIIGSGADDQTLPTIMLYIRGLYTKEMALEMLLPTKYSNQYVFNTKKALEHLSYIGCDEV